MKTISKLFGVVAAIAALAACSKEAADVKPVVPEGMQQVSLSVSASTKTTMDWGSGDFAWFVDSNETIAVVFQKDGRTEIYPFTNNYSGDKSIFSGEVDSEFIPNPENPKEYITDVFYPYIDENATLEDYRNCEFVPATGEVWDHRQTNYEIEASLFLADGTEIIPMHWNNDGGEIKLSADKNSFIKVKNEDFIELLDDEEHMGSAELLVTVNGKLNGVTPYSYAAIVRLFEGLEEFDIDLSFFVHIPFDNDGYPQYLAEAEVTFTTMTGGIEKTKGLFHKKNMDSYGSRITPGGRFLFEPSVIVLNYFDENCEYDYHLKVSNSMLRAYNPEWNIYNTTWGDAIGAGLLEGYYIGADDYFTGTPDIVKYDEQDGMIVMWCNQYNEDFVYSGDLISETQATAYFEW